MEENIVEEQIDFREYLRVILKRKWTIITVFAVIVISVMIYTFTTTPVYEATTRLIIEKENPNVVSIKEVMAVDATSDYYYTQYKIIKSRTIAREVIKRLNLDQSEEFYPKPKDNIFSGMVASVRHTVGAWKSGLTALLKNKSDKKKLKIYDADNALVSGFISRITVEPIRKSRLVDVKFQAKDPVLAAKIAQTLAQAYIDQSMETKLKTVQDAVKWLHNRIDNERKKVEKTEEALLRYKEKYNIVTDFTSDVEKITAQKLAQLNAQVVEAESKRVEAETRYNQALALEGTPDMLDSVPEVLNNELILQIKGMEVDLYKRMSELSKKYGTKHPRMIAVQSELKTLQKRKRQEMNRVINSLKSEYKVSLAKEKSLKIAFAKQKKETLNLNQKAIYYGVLRRDAESARELYELLIKRFKETSLTEEMRTGNIRVVDKAEVPRVPVKPKKQLNILLAVFVGLTFGTGMAFFLEYMDNTVKNPEDIKRYFDVPYLGTIPAIPFEKNGNEDDVANIELVTVNMPKSTASEAYRGIRTGILYSSAESEPQVILVSSAGPREGKTLTSVNLAVTMAQSGSKVVIMDCDLRRPKIHKMFGISRDIGVTNLMVGKKEVDEVICRTTVPNLYVIPSGPIPPNPSEILGSKRMSNLIEVLRKKFTRIIIDSPPVTAVTDAAVLAKPSDGILLVIRANDTAREIVQNSLGQLHAVGANILGAILNCVDIGRDGYYYYQYYYYYYGDDEVKRKKPGKRKRPKGPYQEA